MNAQAPTQAPTPPAFLLDTSSLDGPAMLAARPRSSAPLFELDTSSLDGEEQLELSSNATTHTDLSIEGIR